MSLVVLAIHVALLSLAIAILVPAGLTIMVMIIYVTVHDPEKPPKNERKEKTGTR